ncbi:MAG: ABC transporter permease subunit [Roseburia sp.]
MMNYIKSECYRILHNKKFWVLELVCAGLLTAMVLVLWYFQTFTEAFPYGNTRFALSNIYCSMTGFMYVAAVFMLIFSDSENKNHTIKNSVASGIRRSTIFGGRFVAAAIFTTTTYVALIAVFAALSYALLLHSGEGEYGILLGASAAGSTCLFAALAGTHLFLMLSENESTALLWSVAILVGIPTIFKLLGYKVPLFRWIAALFPFNVLSDYGDATLTLQVNRGLAWQTFLVGAAWLVGFLVIGMIRFQKKEVK